MSAAELSKETLALELGGYTIKRLLEARDRTEAAEPDRPGPAAGTAETVEPGGPVAGRLSLESMLAQASSGSWQDIVTLEVDVGKAAAPGADASAPTIAAPGAHGQEAANHLKAMLAVRDWADPHKLLPAGLDEETAGLALSIVAPEARTDIRLRPGEWYFEVSARRRILANSELTQLRGCAAPLDADDTRDPVRRAFEMLLAEPPAEPDASIEVEVLRAMYCASDWLAGRAAVKRERIAALIEMRLRHDDVDRIISSPLVGRNDQRARLRDFLLKPRSGQRLALLEMYGLGGTGKSTLLAHVEAALRGHDEAPVLVHLDFDRESLDIDDPYSLDLALLDAVAAARPDKASECLGLARELAEMRIAEREDRQSLIGRRSRRLGAPARKGDFGFKEQEALESFGATDSSRRLSLLWGRLKPDSPVGKDLRLALMLDTLENVLARGSSAAHTLAQWLHSLAIELGTEGACVILSGRDPPPENTYTHVPSILESWGHELDRPPIELGELDQDGAVSLLQSHGVEDAATAEAAAAALPRLPLLLRMCADVLTREKKLAGQVRAAHAEGRVDSETSRRYLTNRIVIHVADPVARDYVLATMALTEVTPKLVRRLVVPIVDDQAGRETETGRARQVYDALAAAGWLTARSADEKFFTFHPAIRSLALKLIASDPEQAALVRRIRGAAIDLHERGRSPKDRAFAVYHRLMLGHPPGPVGDLGETRTILARFLDDLPEAGRAALDAGETGILPPSSSEHVVGDEEWRAYLEGIGGVRGQGQKLVQRGDGQYAISLYCDRPTRAPSVPPDFVIQAVAEGEWEDQLVNTDWVLEEIADKSPLEDGRRRVPPTLRARLYWTTRLALLRKPGPLAPLHEALLAGAAADIKAVQGDAALPAIISVAEAFSGSRIGPASWLHSRGAIGRVVRYPLVQSLIHGMGVEWRPPVESLAVLQRDWAVRLAEMPGSPLSVERLHDIQEQLNELHGLPLHYVSRRLRELRQPILLATEGLRPVDQVLLLRGKTTEFLRPLATALVGPIDPRAAANEEIQVAYHSTFRRMSIVPGFPVPARIINTRPSNEQAAWLGAIDLFDQARVLPHFCRRLLEMPSADTSQGICRIASAYLAWDAALTRNGSSEWGSESSTEPGPRDPMLMKEGAGAAGSEAGSPGTLA